MIGRRTFLRGTLAAGAFLALEACGARTPETGPGRPSSPRSVRGPADTASPVTPPTAVTTPPSSSAFDVPPALARRRDFPVRRESLLAGDASWFAGTTGDPAVQGYLSVASVGPGERASLHLAASRASVRVATPVEVDWYRLGWYGGAGARRIARTRSRAVPAGPLRQRSPLGLVEAGYPAVHELAVDRSWTSGMYLAVLRSSSGDAGYVPFVVRPEAGASVSGSPSGATARTSAPGSRAPVLVVSAPTTWQAYNGWGGCSLYSYNSVLSPMSWGAPRAAQVSFDRPYLVDQGAGLLFYWELQFVRWLERQRRDVEYAADVDLVLHPEVFLGRRMVVFQGHHEYWSRGMRDALEALIAGGTNVLFLSANELYQQVRFEDSGLGATRRITCYKDAALDPASRSNPSLASVPWRAEPLNQPEAGVVGQMYAHVVARPADWRVANARHWLYQGTGLRDGDAIPNLVGQEYDTYFPELAPAGTIVLARSPVTADCVDPRTPSVHTATMYVAPSGATVFAAGTFQWSWALDGFGRRTWAGIRTPLDRRVGIMTANLLDRLGDGVGDGMPADPKTR